MDNQPTIWKYVVLSVCLHISLLLLTTSSDPPSSFQPPLTGSLIIEESNIDDQIDSYYTEHVQIVDGADSRPYQDRFYPPASPVVPSPRTQQLSDTALAEACSNNNNQVIGIGIVTNLSQTQVLEAPTQFNGYQYGVREGQSLRGITKLGQVYEIVLLDNSKLLIPVQNLCDFLND